MVFNNETDISYKQWGTEGTDTPTSASIFEEGREGRKVYVGGYTTGNFPGYSDMRFKKGFISELFYGLFYYYY